MSDIMIDIREATMDFRVDHENANSLKEVFVNKEYVRPFNHRTAP